MHLNKYYNKEEIENNVKKHKKEDKNFVDSPFKKNLSVISWTNYYLNDNIQKNFQLLNIFINDILLKLMTYKNDYKQELFLKILNIFNKKIDNIKEIKLKIWTE